MIKWWKGTKGTYDQYSVRKKKKHSSSWSTRLKTNTVTQQQSNFWVLLRCRLSWKFRNIMDFHEYPKKNELTLNINSLEYSRVLLHIVVVTSLLTWTQGLWYRKGTDIDRYAHTSLDIKHMLYRLDWNHRRPETVWKFRATQARVTA